MLLISQLILIGCFLLGLVNLARSIFSTDEKSENSEPVDVHPVFRYVGVFLAVSLLGAAVLGISWIIDSDSIVSAAGRSLGLGYTVFIFTIHSKSVDAEIAREKAQS